MKIGIIVLFTVLLVLGCAPKATATPEYIETLSPATQVATLTQSPSPTLTPVIAPSETATMVPVNPYKGRIWNQKCELVIEDEVIVGIECAESWAEEKLPGGCENFSIVSVGNSGCTATALAYVINIMVSPEEIERVTKIGNWGVTPGDIIQEIYPKVGVRLTCKGTSVSTVRDTLTYFGLYSRTQRISKQSLEKSIRPGEMVLLGLRMTFNGQESDHWTVPVRFENGEPVFADSYVGQGNEVFFSSETGVTSWEITSVLFVSNTPY